MGQGSASRSRRGSRQVRRSLLLPELKEGPAQRAVVPTQSIRLRSRRALAPRTCGQTDTNTCRGSRPLGVTVLPLVRDPAEAQSSGYWSCRIR